MAKLIVITGISRGLGLAMTEQLIQQGHTVLLKLSPKDNGVPLTVPS